MDFLRSCYRQRIRFVDGDESQTAVATWYFASKTAKPFPGPHSFGSPTWDIVHPTPTTIGFNALASKSYYNGSSLNSSRGDRFAGKQSWFVTGAPSPANLPRALNGTPLECLTPPLGIQLSGTSVNVTGNKATLLLSAGSYDPTPPWVCGLCADASPITVDFTVAGFTDPAFNGSWSLPRSPTPCFWRIPVGSGFIEAQRHHLDGWLLLFDDGSGEVARYTNLFDPNCLGSKVLFQVSSSIGGPANITVFGIP